MREPYGKSEFLKREIFLCAELDSHSWGLPGGQINWTTGAGCMFLIFAT
jgi:hypothetical protein